MYRSGLLTGALALCAFATPAWAADPRTLAREAYDRGTLAFHRGDFAAAAASFRDADDALPSPVALRAALDAAVKADDPLLGADLLERARTRPTDPALTTSVRAAESKLAHRVGGVHVMCAISCEAEIDGVGIGTGAIPAAGVTRRALPGSHTVLLRIDGRSASVLVTVAVDQVALVVPPDDLLRPPPTTAPVVAPSPPPVAPPLLAPTPARETAAPSHGIPRAWFWAGTAVTAAAGVTSAVLLHHASTDHSSFVSQDCSTIASKQCQSLSSDGRTFTISGDVTLGLAGAAGIFTLASGVWLVHWKDSGVSATVSPTAAVMTWGCSF